MHFIFCPLANILSAFTVEEGSVSVSFAVKFGSFVLSLCVFLLDVNEIGWFLFFGGGSFGFEVDLVGLEFRQELFGLSALSEQVVLEFGLFLYLFRILLFVKGGFVRPFGFLETHCGVCHYVTHILELLSHRFLLPRP